MHPLPEPMSSLGGTNPDLEKALNPQQERTSKKHLLCNVLLLSGPGSDTNNLYVNKLEPASQQCRVAT
ncbi:unnamed protein product [Rangifer tarandus platyrhynchus]|uniref:Uncharacterized protein n=1 Tax=Rangifer tarandus platyrhynchus TaxID=3082113 RepID=A0ABN8YDT9_RANTA|nr:unnamed protein product [Rangifer tarandus platyrhynchus]